VNYTYESRRFDEAKAALVEAALIDYDCDGVFQLHRTFDEEIQRAFDVASILLCHIFLKQIMGRPSFLHWETCKNYIQHAISLCWRYKMLRQTHDLKLTPSFLNFRTSRNWYLYEIGDHVQNLPLALIVKHACTDKANYVYSNILNSEAVSEFETNHTRRATWIWNERLAIRRKFIEPKDENLMNTINNSGRSETSEDRWETALRHLDGRKRSLKLLVKRLEVHWD
jgi:hypothetical protein